MKRMVSVTAPLRKDIIRANLQVAGERVGVKLYPHRPRHTCATQLLNAGCRITSIQRFLAHKKLSSTMIYAKAHDQTVADDYFSATQRVEERLEIMPMQEETMEDVKVRVVQDADKILTWMERLALPELCHEERLEIVGALRMLLEA